MMPVRLAIANLAVNSGFSLSWRGVARARNLKLLRLETNKSLKEAESLYRSSGYVEVDPFNDKRMHITGSKSTSSEMVAEKSQIYPPQCALDH
jgi:hypothetical protein